MEISFECKAPTALHEVALLLELRPSTKNTENKTRGERVAVTSQSFIRPRNTILPLPVRQDIESALARDVLCYNLYWRLLKAFSHFRMPDDHAPQARPKSEVRLTLWAVGVIPTRP